VPNPEPKAESTSKASKEMETWGLLPANAEIPKSTGFQLPGEIGKLLGNIIAYKYSIVLTGDPHAGKTEVLMQILNGFLDINKNVALFSVEQGGIESELTSAAIDRNVSPTNKGKLKVSAQAPSMEQLKLIGQKFDVVAIDSWQKLGLPNTRFDELRHECPNTIWITIFQQNGEGGTRGGVSADYDSPVILKVHKVDKTFVNNYVEVKKNRGNRLDRYYIVASKKIHEGFEPPTPKAD
jgi:GTPase SAR1 family protein